MADNDQNEVAMMNHKTTILDSVKNIIYILVSVIALGQAYLTIHDKITRMGYALETLQRDSIESEDKIEDLESDIEDFQYQLNSIRQRMNNNK